MNKQVVTAAIVQKGYQDAAAIKFFGAEDSCAEFIAAEPYYDPKAEKHTSWNNWHIKAFRQLCEKIKKMGLKEGSRISFCGTVKTERWTSKEGKQRQRFYVMLEDIEYASTGSKKTEPAETDTAAPPETKPEPTGENTGSTDGTQEASSVTGFFSMFDDDNLPFLTE